MLQCQAIEKNQLSTIDKNNELLIVNVCRQTYIFLDIYLTHVNCDLIKCIFGLKKINQFDFCFPLDFR